MNKATQAIRNAEAKQSSFLKASDDASELQQVKETCELLSTTFASTSTEFLIAMIAVDFDAFLTMRKREAIYSSVSSKAKFVARRSNETVEIADSQVCDRDTQKDIHRHYAKRLNLRVEHKNDSIIDVDANDNSSKTKKLLQKLRVSDKAAKIIVEYREAICKIHALDKAITIA